MRDESMAWLAVAYAEAQQSPDPSTQVGAVLVLHDNAGVFCGHNSPVAGFTGRRMYALGGKSHVMEHAEQAAIFNALSYGHSVAGATLYAPWASCVECARVISRFGIRSLVRHQPLMMRTPTRWRPSIIGADAILTAGNVKIVEIENRIGDLPPIRFNGEIWQG